MKPHGKSPDALQVALALLPADSTERHSALRSYFCDKDALATAGKDAWSLQLTWNDEVPRYVDPLLPDGLVWWGGGVTPSTMWSAERRVGRALLTLFDTWTLRSWSSWLARQERPPSHVNILHVDDHRDLSSPRLFLREGAWFDLISQKQMTLDDPTSVAASIATGALGMGSFMTPFIHHVPSVCVRHLCQPPKSTATSDFALSRGRCADTLLAPGASRPTVELGRPGDATASYRVTPHVTDWLTDLPQGPTLLHIDMDYFNNRYDGDSDWPSRSPRLDPPQRDIDAKITELGAALSLFERSRQLEDVVIALSPGFFPVEFWDASIAKLRSALGGCHG